MAVQMTREQYQQKYGQSPVSQPAIVASPQPAFDNSPAIPRMTRAEYQAKYFAPPPTPTTQQIGTLTINPQSNPVTFGNPLKTIQSAGGDVYNALTGTEKYSGKSSLERGFSAASSAAMAVPGVVANVIPGGTAALNLAGTAFEKATNFLGSVPNLLADAAMKAGVMNEVQRRQYDSNNGAFAGTPLGHAIESGASVLNSAGNIATVILGAHQVAQVAQDFLTNKVPEIKQTMAEERAAAQQQQQNQMVQDTANEIGAVENRYSRGRKLQDYAKDSGSASRSRIAQSGVLKNSIDENGQIRTLNNGGAYDQYEAMTIKPVEGVVRDLLAREGGKTNIAVIRQYLTDSVMNSGLEGADLQTALNGIDNEIAGLRIRANDLGYVPNEYLQDAKISTTKNIDYTNKAGAVYRKAVGHGYKTLIEDSTNLPIKAINADLAPIYEDLNRLKQLDGMKVVGGRLGKYTAQITGTILGGAFGSIFGGFGAGIGAAIGGEVGSLVKGKSMAGTFDNGIIPSIEQSPLLQKAAEIAKSPRPALPQGTDMRSQTVGAGVINLPEKSASTLDNQSINLGNRNTIYANPSNINTTAITPNPTTSEPVVNSLSTLAQEALKYKTPEEFVKAQPHAIDGSLSASVVDKVFDALPDGTKFTHGDITLTKTGNKIIPSGVGVDDVLKQSFISKNADGSIKLGGNYTKYNFVQDTGTDPLQVLIDTWKKAHTK